MIETLAAIVGIILGAVAIYFVERFKKLWLINQAKAEALAVKNEAQENADYLIEEAKQLAQEIEEQIWEKNQKDIANLEKRTQERDASFRAKQSAKDRAANEEKRKFAEQEQVVVERENKLNARQSRFAQGKQAMQAKLQELKAAWVQTSGLDVEGYKSVRTTEVENQIVFDIRKRYAMLADEIKGDSEFLAKRILTIAMGRMQRPACTERGVGVVYLPQKANREKIIGNNGALINTLAEICGVEMTLGDHDNFQVISQDPMKREISTRCLERLVLERDPNPEIIKRIYKRVKEQTEKKTESDGARLAAELGQKTLHPEIKKMLGVLRYRYSFAQNQFFHVGEVGWLCGLIAGELGGTDVGQARRSGLLHDVGKAMDHDREGGHAVIGADFINERGEAQPVVHAVRAHHFEEQPATDMAFLVVGADAVSGARPGARRSMVTAYNQKIEALSTIADGIQGVTRSLIFNGGRELRLLVDPRKIDDMGALKLCREIAQKVEEQCTYPGQIKVIVVREAFAEAMAT